MWCNSQVVKLAVLLRSYGLDQQPGTGLDVLQHVCEPEQVAPARVPARPTAMAGVLRLNARQRRTLRRAHERAVSAMNELSCDSVDSCRRRLELEIAGGEAGRNMTASLGGKQVVGLYEEGAAAGVSSRPRSAESTETVHCNC